MTPRSSNSVDSDSGSTAKWFFIAALVDFSFYAIYRFLINPSGLLESDDLFYFELAESSISNGLSPVLHLADLNRANVLIIQLLFEGFNWSDPSLFVCPGIALYWFSAYKLLGGRDTFRIIVPIVLLLYPDIMYVRYHMFKDIILVSLIAFCVHFYDRRRLDLALAAALMCAPFRFYLFPLIILCVALQNIRRFGFSHLAIGAALVFLFLTQVDIFSIATSSLDKDTFGSGGDYTVRRVAESLGISNPFVLMPLVALSFFLQPSPNSIIGSTLDQIVPYSFLSTYFLLIPSMIYILKHKRVLAVVRSRSANFIFIFSLLYVATFAFDPVLADMRHRVILILPIFMLFFQVKLARNHLKLSVFQLEIGRRS